MRNIFANFCKFSAVLAAIGCVDVARADQAPNPRSAAQANVAPARADAVALKRGGKDADVMPVAARAAVQRSGTVASRNSGSVKKKTARNAVNVRSGTPALVRSAFVARSAVGGRDGNARSAADDAGLGMVRAASRARATAVFNDISKIGGGYSACREAYATCMDQFCANANDTYRRCYCSSRFTDFYSMEQAMDEAKVLLQKFEDNNLNAIDKTADEVSAMYSATVGEAAIKKDTSGAQSILNEIGDLLSGKKKVASSGATASGSTSLGVISLDFSTDIGDIWNGGGDFDSVESVFGGSKAVDMTMLEGQALYNASNKQCVQIIRDSCESEAILNMATSAYNIMITQDCNLYEKKLNQKREQVLSTVRQAERILRDARLEEYRAHNSRDVNECITKVQNAMLAETACGANYKRCLDYTGAYINPQTGDPIYSPRLFELTDVITLAGVSGENKSDDVLAQNTNFDKFLETKKMYAEMALDSCRSIADTVWTEFKRMALIEIAQAQDAKIEEVKLSCVNTMAECYDTQTNALKSFDNTTAKTSGAISAYAAKEMCQDKVIACASLYGNTEGCQFDGNGRLTTGNDAKDASTRCGLTSLLAFVDSVDNVRIAEGCDTALETQLKEWCTPSDGSKDEYPWNCRRWGADELAENLYKFALNTCYDPNKGLNAVLRKPNPSLKDLESAAAKDLDLSVRNKITQALDEIQNQLEYQFAEKCEELHGYWIDDTLLKSYTGAEDLSAFYTTVYGKGFDSKSNSATQWGRCVQNTTRVLCEAYNSTSLYADKSEDPVAMATYDATRDECVFSDKWFENQCSILGGYYDGSSCYVGK